jgi:hypothetical protein
VPKVEAPPPARRLSAMDWDEFVAGHRIVEARENILAGFLALPATIVSAIAIADPVPHEAVSQK